MIKYTLAFLLSFFLISASYAEDVYLSPEDFLKQTFAGDVPKKKLFFINDSNSEDVERILEDTYHMPYIKYWRKDNKIAFILEQIGKHEFITTGFVVQDNKIFDAKVLIYREKYGWEIKYESFLRQVRNNSITSSGKLQSPIGNISGATLSVNAMKRLTKFSIFLYSSIMK
tara:strand:- start:2705 stop:3217 length:513 start_codon:yes stop_codon:yes gene_type:complete